MEWEVEFRDEFSNWWDGLSEAEQVDVNAKVILLRKIGPSRPQADLIHSSRHPNMSFGYNIRGDRIECSLLLICADAQSC